MRKRKIIIGSRGSKLAILYAEKAKEKIMSILDGKSINKIEIKKIITQGDKVLDKRVSEIGGKGLFAKNIEKELLDKKIDLAVHALKDMPSIETKGLLTNIFLERNDPREVLVTKNGNTLENLKKNSVVGTSSFRREFQIKNKRSDIQCKLIRGNVETRIKKLDENFYDAIILSYAGINKLKLNSYISQIFSTSEIIPSVGQGVIALQCRKDDNELIDLLKEVNHTETFNRVIAERNVLKVLEGDCETAVGAHAKINGNDIEIEAELFSLDGKKRFYKKMTKKTYQAKDLGMEVGKFLKEQSKNSYKK